MTSPHFHALTPLQHKLREYYSNVRGFLRLTPYVVDAQGARFVVGTTDYIDRCIAFFGIWEQQQLEDLAQLSATRKIDYFLDVGANAGFYSIMFAVKNLAGRIVAFEPDPGNYARLMANINANSLAGRIETIPLALGNEASEVILYEGAKWNRGESTIVVPEQTPQEVTFRVRQARFDDQYWLQRDKDGKFPEEFCRAIADGGWVGTAVPEAYGGSGLGTTESALVVQAISESGAANKIGRAHV